MILGDSELLYSEGCSRSRKSFQVLRSTVPVWGTMYGSNLYMAEMLFPRLWNVLENVFNSWPWPVLGIVRDGGRLRVIFPWFEAIVEGPVCDVSSGSAGTGTRKIWIVVGENEVRLATAEERNFVERMLSRLRYGLFFNNFLLGSY